MGAAHIFPIRLSFIDLLCRFDSFDSMMIDSIRLIRLIRFDSFIQFGDECEGGVRSERAKGWRVLIEHADLGRITPKIPQNSPIPRGEVLARYGIRIA